MEFMDQPTIFEQLVEKEFEFLVKEYGYKLIHSDKWWHVHYESNTTNLDVWYDHCVEIYICIGLKTEKVDYIQYDILDAIIGKHRLYQCTSYDNLKWCLGEIANLAKTHLKPFVLGDLQAFKLVKSYRENRTGGRILGNPFLQQRGIAEEAWRKKDFREVA